MVARWLTVFAACLVVCTADCAERKIYRCQEAGVITFSDRPCGGSAEVYTFDTVEPAPLSARPLQPTQPIDRPARAPSRRSKPASPKAVPNITDCARLDRELRSVAARMRAGYGAAEGERLRERQQGARARRRELRCR